MSLIQSSTGLRDGDLSSFSCPFLGGDRLPDLLCGDLDLLLDLLGDLDGDLLLDLRGLMELDLLLLLLLWERLRLRLLLSRDRDRDLAETKKKSYK